MKLSALSLLSQLDSVYTTRHKTTTLFYQMYSDRNGETLSEREADKLEKFVKELNLRGAKERLGNSAANSSQSDLPTSTITANDDLSDLSDDDENLYPDVEKVEEMKFIRLRLNPTCNPKIRQLFSNTNKRSDYGQRGIDRFDIGESQKEGESVSPPLAKVPGDKNAEAMNRLNYDDLLVVKSSMESFISKSHPECGSLMVRALVSSMYKHACHHDLYTIFKQVQTKVRKLCLEKNLESGGQLVVVWDTLTHMRKLYLFPGFNGH
ncbi:hypothetical protein EB796_002635 [Bugula neritina]|uniref:Caspase family p10 domain-containing protein n=1 Tax=Bugula neritina TaxID=10212 RepID=A0A7J7KL28_BUGNE|nr:hypothetical protein EB796_002635 [Bugula neritina]